MDPRFRGDDAPPSLPRKREPMLSMLFKYL
jgi:hypothetical protein